MNAAVVPEPSERWTTWIPSEGRFVPGLSAAMAGSFQVLILPAKMLASVEGDSLRLLTPATLYSMAMGPAAQMICWAPPGYLALAAACSLAAKGTSLAPKFTVPAVNCCTPAPEPTLW